MKAIRIIRAGLCATVQDRGRFGFQDRGIPVSGAMDPWAWRVGNLLVGNSGDEASIEVTLGGLEAECLSPTVMAVTGANEGTSLNGHPVPSWTAFRAEPGDRLTIPYARRGARDYIALSGGIEVPLVMGSRSTYLKGCFGGLEGRALRKGDELHTGGTPKGQKQPRGAALDLIPAYTHHLTLRVIPGPQDEEFTAEGLRTFYNSHFTVTPRSDRMGCVLNGPEIRHRRGPDIISDGTAFGSIQVPGSGRPIILLADRQTTGGYVKIATVITCDLPLIAQALPGYEVRFQAVTVPEAQDLLREREKALENYLTAALP